MTLAIFDLDHTLLDGDSDYLWGEYMVANALVDADDYRQRNRDFFAQYQRGELDVERYLEFALEPLTRHSLETLHRHRADFVARWIEPIVAAGARALLASHRDAGHELMIVSATHRFVTEPIAALLDVPTLLATEPEIVDGRYTGRFLGTPTYRDGKVSALRAWLRENGRDLAGSYFYSDSINDLPLLETVEHPIAVHPDDDLRAIASRRAWKIVDDLR